MGFEVDNIKEIEDRMTAVSEYMADSISDVYIEAGRSEPFTIIHKVLLPDQSTATVRVTIPKDQ